MSIEMLKNEIIYKNSLQREKCPICNKIYWLQNKTKRIKCEVCKKDFMFYEIINIKPDIDFINMVNNCNDEIKLKRSLSMLERMHKMNDKEYNDNYS